MIGLHEYPSPLPLQHGPLLIFWVYILESSCDHSVFPRKIMNVYNLFFSFWGGGKCLLKEIFRYHVLMLI